MRTIRKGKEPASLLEYRKKPDATYDGYPDKQDVRNQLVREQRGLCCYCQSRIFATWDGMKIEHWRSQSPNKFPERQLDYANMLGACMGGQKNGQKSPPQQHHCDTLKGDLDLCFSVCDPDHPIERQIRFSSSGRIDSKDADIDNAINDVLNLNLVRLVENRKHALTGFLQGLGKRSVDYAKELTRWDGSADDELPPFSQIVAHYLLRKLGRLGA